MSKHKFVPQNVCAKLINFTLDKGAVRDLSFKGGCHGNLQGLSLLSEGRSALEVADLLESVVCKGSKTKQTSCPAQLARGLREAVAKNAKAAAKRAEKRALKAAASKMEEADSVPKKAEPKKPGRKKEAA